MDDLWRVETWNGSQWRIVKDRLLSVTAERMRDALRRKGHVVRMAYSAITIDKKAEQNERN